MVSFPLVILAHVAHPSVIDGFLPAARRLGLPLVIVTDCRLEHLERLVVATDTSPVTVVECDVFNPLAVIDALCSDGIRPHAVFSNSDHLQTSAALVAEAFGLPCKDWRVCYAAKNKAAMRERLRERGLPSPWFYMLAPGAQPPDDTPYPLIAKPREGVASLDVRLCADAGELRAYLDAFRLKGPERSVLLEGCLEGPLFTLETLGDGRRVQAIGGFDVVLSAPPHFIEHEALWNGQHGVSCREQAVAQVLAFGVGFGACHSEFVLTASGPVLVEINYRSIGDGREFMLETLLPDGWFERILHLHLGKPLPDAMPGARHGMVRYYVATEEGRLSLSPPDRVEDVDGAHGVYRALRKDGDEIRLTHSNRDYLGVLSLVAESDVDLAQALARIESDLCWRIAPLGRKHGS
jgi:biotin carboxylase